MARHDLDRRQALTGAAVVGVGVPFLTACGGTDGSDGGTATEPSGSPTTVSPSGSATPSPTASASPTETASVEAPPADVLTTTADVPEGGGTVLADDKVVVTQPTAGEFKCFTAVCTHRGCIVSDVADGTINCGCHGSRFSIVDGSVRSGPATAPLGAERISVRGGSISLS